MTLESYKQRAAEFRTHMEQPMPVLHCVLNTKESAYLPGGEKRSKKPKTPEWAKEDFSHLNSTSWKKLKAAGRRNGRKPKR